tara:strand:+ start:406 stop:624 length:219 start_codon:yes stop_codon:yes gene_type:complete
MSDLFNELNEIIGEGLLDSMNITKQKNSEVKEFVVEVRFYIKAFNAGEASIKIENVLDREDLEFQVDSSEEV